MFAHPLHRFMELITNGSMYFDPRLHTLPFVRSRSSFLLAVILAIASTYRSICPSARLHALLMSHAHRLENVVRNNHLKSIEIIQGLLLLASWTEIPSTLARDKTWMFVSHALALVVELRLDTSLPYCVQTDPLYHKDNHDLLVRNAHRVCFLMYIHDRVSDWKTFFLDGCTEMVVEHGDGGGLASDISRFCFNDIRFISKMGKTSCKVEFLLKTGMFVDGGIIACTPFRRSYLCLRVSAKARGESIMLSIRLLSCTDFGGTDERTCPVEYPKLLRFHFWQRIH